VNTQALDILVVWLTRTMSSSALK